MKHMLFRWLGLISWLITALISINVGLRPFGYDFMTSEFMLVNMSQFIEPLHYIILIAGIVSLVLLVMSFMWHCSDCNSSSCGCK
jgi:hypothetical protein